MKKFIPKIDELYYYIDVNYCGVNVHCNKRRSEDYLPYKYVFKTKTEAKIKAVAIKKILKCCAK